MSEVAVTELQRRIALLREERRRRQLERLELLKSINTKKTLDRSFETDSAASSKPTRLSTNFRVPTGKTPASDRFVRPPSANVSETKSFKDVKPRIDTGLGSRRATIAPRPRPEPAEKKTNERVAIVERSTRSIAATVERLSRPKAIRNPSDLAKPPPESAKVSRKTIAPNPPRKSIAPNPSRKTIAPNPPQKSIMPNPSRKTIAPNPQKSVMPNLSRKTIAPNPSRKTIAPNPQKSVTSNPSRKTIVPNPSRKTIAPNPSRKTLAPEKALKPPGLRRSLSTVHFNKLGANERRKCFRRSLSVGDFKNGEIEDELPGDFPPAGYFLPVVSERKKSVSFLTPSKNAAPPLYPNTPRPSELRKRLDDWLRKRGKSLSNFHHLKCFGLHRVDEPIDDENKENVEVHHDDSFHENITGEVVDMARAESGNSPIRKVLTERDPANDVESELNPVVTEALFDLHRLILEDYSWEQCAEWLRAIVKECGEKVKNVSAYWECRAALEEKRGDFIRTVDCVNNALQRGARPNHIEECLDSLLEKFMTLNLDASATKTTNKKIVDAKNVFKTSLIKFAIKMQNNEYSETKPSFVATPVRRSSRLSTVFPGSGVKKNFTPRPLGNIKLPEEAIEAETPSSNREVSGVANSIPKSGRKHLVQLCDSLRNVENDVKQTLIFVPNKALTFNDCV